MQQLVISALGPDRAGLVDDLTEALGGYGANIADSRMVNLRGQFALVMLVEVAEDRAGTLRDELPAAGEKQGLTVLVREAPSREATPVGRGVPYRVRTYAMDQAGLVHRIAHALREHKVNIEELQTHLEEGAYTGTPVFSMDMIVTVPREASLRRLRSDLEVLCDELNCDLDIDRA